MPGREYDRIKALLQAALESVPAEQGGVSGFVQRTSKVTAVLFVQILVLGCWRERVTTLADLVQVGHRLGVQVSSVGLHQRLNAAAVVLLQAVLQAVLAQRRPVATGCAIFGRFAAVYLQDSTYVSLPAALAGQLAGSGGCASAAGAKVVLNYEYRSGALAALEVVPGRRADQGCRQTVQVATPGSLHIFDLGFYALELLRQLAEKGSYFLCRHQYQTALYSTEEHPVRLELLPLLKAHFTHCTAQADQKAQDVWEFEALLGAQTRIPVRIVVNRLPAAVVAKRRRRIRAAAKRRGYTPAALTLALAQWNIFCTNVPTAVWSAEQVLAAYPIRWQVELLFKLCKSQAGLDCIGDWRPARVLCFFYARLIALALSQHIIAPLRFSQDRELSPAKAFHLLQHALHDLPLRIRHRWRGLRTWLAAFVADCRSLAWKDKRVTRPSTYCHLSATNA